MDWSAKAGCTVSVMMFFEHMKLLEEARNYASWIHVYRIEVNKKNHPISIEDLLNPEFFKFKIVRNPYSRVISSYLAVMNFVNNRVLKKPTKIWLEIKTEIINVLQLETSDLSFRQFIDYLQNIDIRSCDQHIAQQRRYYENEFEWDKICKLENIEEDMQDVNRLTGADFKIKGKTSHHHTSKNEQLKEYVSEKPWSAVKDQIPRYSFFYTSDLAEKVAKLFYDDINAYRYSFDDFIRLDA